MKLLASSADRRYHNIHFHFGSSKIKCDSAWQGLHVTRMAARQPNRPDSKERLCRSVGCQYVAEESREYCCNRCREGFRRHTRNCTAVLPRRPNRPDPSGRRCCSARCQYVAEEFREYCCNRCRHGIGHHTKNCTALLAKAMPKEAPKRNEPTPAKAMPKKKQKMNQPMPVNASASSDPHAAEPTHVCPFSTDAGHRCTFQCRNWSTSPTTGMPIQINYVTRVLASDTSSGEDMD